uniref:Uncharacterized protein n=1 Tax=Anopheles minimus TaxID=112268 RepID=A0A182W0W1_9DIPT
MGDFLHSAPVPKKYYRYFLKGLAYYTCHLNKACTLADLQAYVHLKSLKQLSGPELISVSYEVMGELVATQIAYNQNGYYRLNELLRTAHGSPSKQAETISHSRDSELSSGSGLKKMVNFSNTVTMWDIETVDGAVSIAGAVNNPTPYQVEFDHNMHQEGHESAANNTDTGNKSDSDMDEDEDNEAEMNPSAVTAETEPETGNDSDSNKTDDDEDKGSPDTQKQEPQAGHDSDSNLTDDEDKGSPNTRKQEPKARNDSDSDNDEDKGSPNTRKQEPEAGNDSDSNKADD